MPEPERIGPYRLIRLLGAGGMGEVFLAHDERLDRQVAIKRLRTSSEVSPERRKRFRREARIAARLKHPNIVQIHDVLSEGEIDCIVMEYVDGQDLRQRSKSVPPSIHETLVIAGQIALAMAEAHDQGIIHRDLKTENVLITRTGQVKITDFGIAKDLRDETLTADGHLMGTSRSMSPEQASGKPLDHRSDLFSFGTLLYEVLAGKSPFLGETSYLTMHRVVHDAPEPLRALVPGLPPALAALIEQLLAKEPLLRPRSFHEVAQVLAQFQGLPCTGTPPGGRPPSGSDGDTAPTEDSEPGPGGAAALSPIARLVGQTPADLVETESMPPTMAPVPAAPAPPTPVAPAPPTPAAQKAMEQDGKPGDQGSAMAPSVSPALRRARWRLAVIMILAGAALALGLGYGIWRATREPATRLRVAVSRPSIKAPAELVEAELLAFAVRIAIVRGLLSLDGIDALPLDDVDLVIDGYERERRPQPLQRELIDAVGADELIAAGLECTQQSCRVSLQRIVDGSVKGEPTWFDMSIDEVGGPAQPVVAHVSRLFPDRSFRDRAAAVHVKPEDYQAFLRLRKAYWEGADEIATDETFAELAAIRARSQGFLELYRLEAELLLRRYRRTGDPDALPRALALMQEAEEQAPDAYDILVIQGQLALEAGKSDLIEDTLRRLDALDPGSGSTLLLHAEKHRRNDDVKEKEKALAFLESAAARDSSWRILYKLASMEQDLGRWEAADKHIAQLLERSPGNYAGLSLKARAALNHGNPACAAEWYGELVNRRQSYEECNNLGVAQMMLDLYQEAVESFRCALAIRPNELPASFNLAESLKLSGDEAAAAKQFRQLLASVQKDGDQTSASLRRKAQVLAHLAGSEPALAEEARALIQRVLDDDPESHKNLYAAAVVHALLGDQDQAAAHVRTLLDQKLTTDWFRFPWFDGVREHADLRQRLTYLPPSPACE